MKQDSIDEKGAYNLAFLPTEDGKEGDKALRKLSDILFLKKESADAKDDNGYKPNDEDLRNLKEEFKRLIGDVEINLKAPQNADPSKTWLRTLDMNFIAPTENNGRRGIALENWSEVQVVWESINRILYDYCEFIKSDPNADKEPGEMVIPSTYENIGKEENGRDPWELASAPDLPLTQSLVDQLFHLVKKSYKPDQLNCTELQLTRDDIPTTRDVGGGQGQQANLNDCGKKKGCQRNRLVLHMSFIIARSRSLHTYLTLYMLSKRFATDEALDNLVDELFVRTLSGMKLDDELARNRESWDAFTLFLAKVQQGESGAGGFGRPSGGN
jgi:hypothetical protein